MPSNALPIMAGAALLSAALTCLLVRFSLRLRLIAQPRLDRWHKLPTPNTGGLAVFLTCVLLYTIFAWGRYPMIATAAAGIAVLGFLDDRMQLRPLVKFLAQSVCVIAVMASGVVFRATPWEAANLALTFLWIAGITNAFNLIDNMDGLCAGVAVIISASRYWFAVQTGDAGSSLISALLCGSFLGFLVFNYRPAKIFMGDCGSMLAGFTLGALAIASPVPRTRVFVSAIFFPALTFLYPIFDTVLVSFLRRAAGRPISVGGRDHSSHRLVSLGLSERTVVWLLWGLTALGSAAGLLTYSMPFGVVAIGFLLVIGVTVLGVFLGTLPNYAPPDTAPVRSTWFRRRIPTLRAGITLVVDVLLSGVALLSAFLVRWDQAFLGGHANEFLISLPVVMLGHALASLSFRTFNLGWRWFGLRDLIELAKCVLLGLTLSMFMIWMAGMRGYSRGVVVLYGFFIFASSVGLRVSMRFLWQTLAGTSGKRRAAIIGGGVTGELLVLVLQRDSEMNARPVLILDSDPAAEHTRIHGVPVRYLGDDPVKALKRSNVELVVLPGNGAFTPEHQQVALTCKLAGLAVEQCELSMHPVPDAVQPVAKTAGTTPHPRAVAAEAH